MTRDRARTAVETYLLQILLKAGNGEFDGRLLTTKSFAEKAGLSRQALYKGHRDVIGALAFMSKVSTPQKASDSNEKEASIETQDLETKLSGALKQNQELLVQVYELKQQLRDRGLK